jgi:phospholipid-binding lipoprotein MlaA
MVDGDAAGLAAWLAETLAPRAPKGKRTLHDKSAAGTRNIADFDPFRHGLQGLGCVWSAASTCFWNSCPVSLGNPSSRSTRGIFGILRPLGLVLSLGLAACGPATLPPGDTIEDASEVQNRAVHRFNVSLDRALVGPASNAYGTVVPAPVRQGVSNFASNLNQPGYVLNDLLQLRIGDAAQNTLRFAINSTIGIGGLLDPATAIGLPTAETGFGETMHVYGLGEGDYHVLPVFGPSTTRDSVGLIVDFAMNPLRHVVEPPETGYLAGARVLARFGDRHDFAGSIEDILYRSEDSYTSLRSLYLQNRRFELRGGGEAVFEPVGENGAVTDAGGAAVSDPYDDLYFDPYSQ